MSFFKLKENNTSFKTEVIAGLTTFLAMVYIIPVNSSIVGNTGMPIEALITATALITIVASAFNAFFANTPVAMSVGMGLNAYFTFAVCLGQNIAWQSALGAVFISSIIFLILFFYAFSPLGNPQYPKRFTPCNLCGHRLFYCIFRLKSNGCDNA